LTTLLLLFVVLASSLGVFGVAGIVVFVLVVGLALYVRQGWPLMSLLLAVLCLMCLIALLLPAVQSAREAARRCQCQNNLKQIALTLLNYESANGCFPPAYIADKNGKPMHSWRVLILPYLEQTPLYQAYDFSEPWDGPKNKLLSANCLPQYICPSERKAQDTETNYVAVLGKNTAWPGEKARKPGPRDFPGGANKTVMVVEVANSGIHWAEPRDLSLDALDATGAKSPPLTVSSNHRQEDDFFFIYDRYCGAYVALADGGVRYLPPSSLSPEHLRKLLEVGGFREEEASPSVTTYNGGRRLNWPNIAALAVWLFSVGALLYRAVRSRNARQRPSLTTSSRT
jgi:type II secretory pathway pseudopilin PulG